MLEPIFVFRHHHANKIGGSLISSGIINDNLIDIISQVIPDCPDNDVTLLVDQHGRFIFVVGLGYRVP